MSICKKPYNRVQQEVKSRKCTMKYIPVPSAVGLARLYMSEIENYIQS